VLTPVVRKEPAVCLRPVLEAATVWLRAHQIQMQSKKKNRNRMGKGTK